VPGCVWLNPMGEVRMEENHHLSPPVRFGRLKEDGQFEIVFNKDELAPPLPWLGSVNGYQLMRLSCSHPFFLYCPLRTDGKPDHLQ
jgi:hypothetical protein